MDPVEIIRRHALRTDYIHFKDIDGSKYADVMGRHIRFFDACAEGVMCPIGRGRIDYSGLHELLTEIGYGATSPSNRSGTRATPMASSRTWPRVGTSCGAPDSEGGRTK